MSKIPPDVVSVTDVAEWYKVKEQLGKLKQKEGLLRGRIFHFFFPTPSEGTNKHPMNDGTGAELKATHVINRSVDPGSLDALKDEMRQEGYNGPALNLDALIKWKPEVSITEYRKLTDEERNFFDRILVIKPGSPQLEVVIPKRTKPAS